VLRELQPLKAAHGINLISPAAAGIYRFQVRGGGRSGLCRAAVRHNIAAKTICPPRLRLALSSTRPEPLPPPAPLTPTPQTSNPPYPQTTPQMSYLPPGASSVNMLRITGRPEQEGQRPPPWGYGDGFDEARLPPALGALAARIRALPGLRLGPLRDVTINHRQHHFYRRARGRGGRALGSGGGRQRRLRHVGPRRPGCAPNQRIALAPATQHLPPPSAAGWTPTWTRRAMGRTFS
jgi:hypothetical protein